jgi:hypothetical protein
MTVIDIQLSQSPALSTPAHTCNHDVGIKCGGVNSVLYLHSRAGRGRGRSSYQINQLMLKHGVYKLNTRTGTGCGYGRFAVTATVIILL